MKKAAWLIGVLGACALVGACSGDDSSPSTSPPIDGGTSSSTSSSGSAISEAGPQDATVSDAGAGIACTVASLPTQTQSDACSLNSGQPFGLTFVNNTARSVSIYWVSYTCEEAFEVTLDACGTFSIQTYVTHPWRIRDSETNTLFKEFIPTSTAVTKVTVQ